MHRTRQVVVHRLASKTTTARRKRATSSSRAAKKKAPAKRRSGGGVWEEILLPHAPSLDDGWRRRPIRGGDVDKPRSSVVRARTGDTLLLGMSGVDRSSSYRVKRLHSHKLAWRKVKL